MDDKLKTLVAQSEQMETVTEQLASLLARFYEQLKTAGMDDLLARTLVRDYFNILLTSAADGDGKQKGRATK